MTLGDPVWQEVTAFLARPDTYGPSVGEVGRIDTHISRLFFAGDRVLKVKKPVQLAFLDMRSLSRRHFLCQEEVRLNRRLAGDVYRGVLAVTREADGALRLDGSGEPVEYAVHMQRLPADRMLDALLDRGEVDHQLLRRVVETLARFHQAAERSAEISARGHPDRLGPRLLGNLDELGALLAEDAGPAAPLQPGLLQALRRRTHAFLATERPLLEQRVREQRFCDGHGDLHAGNLCFLEDRLVIYDCIEFEPAFRQVDVAQEIAFLGMDLQHRGYRAFADHLAHESAARTGDPGLIGLQPLYRSHLAAVRGKVNWLQARQLGEDAAAAERRRDATRYFLTAAACWLPKALIVTCGLPASGKSYVAQHLAAPLEAHWLRSDVVRKRLAGLASTDHEAPAGLYHPAMTRQVYGQLHDTARTELEHGRSVVVDANFPSAAHRAPFLELARSLGVPFLLVHCRASEETVRERMIRRQADPDEVSDADLAVYQKLRVAFEEPQELPASLRLECESPEVGTRTASHALAQLLDQEPGPHADADEDPPQTPPTA